MAHTDYHVEHDDRWGFKALAWRVVNGSDQPQVGSAVSATEEGARVWAEIDLTRAERNAKRKAAR